MTEATLFELPADQFLVRFGSGNATPGSGCAAALMALLATQLVIAIARMTVEKGSAEAKAQCEVLLASLENRIAPRLRELFDLDARLFDEVVALRKARDKSDIDAEKRRFAADSSQKLKEATDLLFEIVDLSFQVFANGLSVWDIGFRPAMGEAGAAVSACVAAVTSCILVISVNVRSSRAPWAKEAKGRCDSVIQRLSESQGRIIGLISESVERSERALLDLGMA